MTTLTEAREALAAAVNTAGLDCALFPPDAPNPPQAWIDSIAVDYAMGSGFSYCLSGDASATIVAAGQRHDKAGSTAQLEALVPAILEALQGIPGVRVTALQSGTVQIAGQDAPAVIYTTQFAISS